MQERYEQPPFSLATRPNDAQRANLCLGGCGKPTAPGQMCNACAAKAVYADPRSRHREHRAGRRSNKKPAPVPIGQLRLALEGEIRA
jgi:hypothetical protein